MKYVNELNLVWVVCVCVFVTKHVFTHMDICGSERQISGCTHQMIQHFMDEINVL